MAKGESGFLAACDLAWEIQIFCWVDPGVIWAPTALGCFQGCLTPQVDGPHVEFGKLWQPTAGQLLYPGGHLVGQHVEGSVQGLTSCSQWSELLYRGQSKSHFCLSAAQRATKRSSLDEIAASQ